MIRSNCLRQALFVSALALTAVGTRCSLAQGKHPIAVGANYTYVHTNLLPGCSCFSMNGGGAQVEYGLRPHFALLGEFTATHRGGITADGYDLTQFTFAGGMRYRPALDVRRVQPFGDLLVGAAHASGSLSPGNTGCGARLRLPFRLEAGSSCV